MSRHRQKLLLRTGCHITDSHFTFHISILSSYTAISKQCIFGRNNSPLVPSCQTIQRKQMEFLLCICNVQNGADFYCFSIPVTLYV